MRPWQLPLRQSAARAAAEPFGALVLTLVPTGAAQACGDPDGSATAVDADPRDVATDALAVDTSLPAISPG